MRVGSGLAGALALSVVVGTLSLPPTATAATRFKGPLDIGTLSSDYAQVIAVNDAGQVVGNSGLRAFSWTAKGGMVDLGTLGGTSSMVSAVNASGQVIGSSDPGGGEPPRPFSWTATGGMVDIDPSGRSASMPTAIADSGQVIGQSRTGTPDGENPRPPMTAFSWSREGGMVDIGSLGGTYTYAYAVNNSGQVIGVSSTAGDSENHAYVWTAKGGMVDLGTLGGSSSAAIALSDAGRVVGSSFTAGDSAQHAFSWTPSGGMVDIGTLGGTSVAPVAVTEAGQVIGTYFRATEEGGVEGAFSWTPSGGMVDIGTLGGPRTTVWGVSDSGQVIGYWTTPDGCDWFYIECANHAYSWTSEGGMVDLGTLGGSNSYPFGVNASGVVVGYSDMAGFDGDVHAFYWTAEQGMVDLGALDDDRSSLARGINNANLVIGSSGQSRAVVWQLSTAKANEKPDKKADKKP